LRQGVNNNNNVIILFIIIKNAHDYSDAVANKTLQGHFILLLICNRRAKYSARNDEWPAEVSHWKLDRKRKVFSSWRNVDSDEAALAEEDKPFHALDAAAGSVLLGC